MQWQILAKNPEQCAQFYRSMFNWEISANNALGYRVVDTGSERGIDGGIWPCPPERKGMVSLYVEVENVAECVNKAKTLGAHVVMGPQILPDGDEMAIVVDPEGLALGLFKPPAATT
jgi:predicted enzyme related to lactoylglutathione lyase